MARFTLAPYDRLRADVLLPLSHMRRNLRPASSDGTIRGPGDMSSWAPWGEAPTIYFRLRWCGYLSSPLR
ncbi:uncharacterized protein METZ01_LOCUS17033 [marine metagenome]|uniref:Uncharacterized protein n=1 Tax=marine metagenome TaxID=408172 RepID=A0A381PDC9_9ZZZZ